MAAETLRMLIVAGMVANGAAQELPDALCAAGLVEDAAPGEAELVAAPAQEGVVAAAALVR